jgi:dihydrofolate reductase
VATHRPIDPPPASPDADVQAVSGTATEIATALAAKGHRQAYVDGGTLIRQFLAAGLVDRLLLTRIPVLIGSGIVLFGELPHDIRLRHEGTTSWSNGMVQSTYRVVSSAA